MLQSGSPVQPKNVKCVDADSDVVLVQSIRAVWVREAALERIELRILSRCRINLYICT